MVDAPLQSKLFVYRMVHDDGAAPCHEGGLSTLAICKPVIRNAARSGDIIIGVVSSTLANASSAAGLTAVTEGAVVYIATVDSQITMQEYCDQHGSRSDAIYVYSSGAAVQKDNPYHDCKNKQSDLRAGVLKLKDVKRCIGSDSAELTHVPSELMATVSRGHLTVEPGGADSQAWMTLAVETATVLHPVHIGSSDKARQQRVKATVEQ